MSLTKEQYDIIMMQYSQARDLHRHELERRKAEIYAKIPAYKQLEDSIPEAGVESLRSSFLQPGSDLTSALQKMRTQVKDVAQKKRLLLQQNGYPADYLQMQYDCPRCRDTGYIDNQKCQCLRQKETTLLYSQSSLRKLFPDNNFGKLSYEYYKGADLQLFQKAVADAHSFVNSFDSHYENLYFYGTVGTGKTFLSICIAQEILKKGHSVLYFSAAELFDRIASAMYNYKDREAYHDLCDDLYNCDLLIIDDLGTETTNSLVSTQLFSCINERDLRKKPTIISTNLQLPAFQARYSDRIFSRITSNYVINKITGTDIRMRKKIGAGQSGS